MFALLLLLLVLLFFGFGAFTIHALLIVGVILAIVWVLGFFVHPGGGRNYW